MPDDQGAPEQRIRDAALLAEERRGLGEELHVDLAEPLEEDRPQHERQQHDGEDGAEDRDQRDELLGPATATEVVRAGGDVVRVGDLGGAHPVDILRAFWNLFTITCADTFVTREMTRRIAPR